MGGLVLSSFLKIAKEKGEIESSVNKAIICNPPFLGSLEAAFSLVIGRSKLINSSDDFRKVARTFPAIYELSPVYDQSFVFDHNPGQEIYFFNYKSYWQREENPVNEKGIRKNELMEYRFKELEKVRANDSRTIFDFSNLSSELRKKFLVLVGSQEDTLETLTILESDASGRIKNFFDFENTTSSRRGDGTVHHWSSTIFKDSILTIDIESKPFETRWNSHLIMNDWHSFFLNNGRVQNIIRRFLIHDEQILAGVNGNKDWFTSPGSAIKKL